MKGVIPNSIFFENVEQLLSEGQSVKIVVQGTSMTPFFRSGVDKVVVAPVDKNVNEEGRRKLFKRGDIVLFHINDSVRLHRIVHIWGTLLLIRGDGCYGRFERATFSDVMGIVTEGTCFGGHPFQSSSTIWRVSAWFWRHTYFIRLQLLRAKKLMRIIFLRYI